MSLGRGGIRGFAVDLGGTKIAAARIEAGAIEARETAATDGAAGPETQVAAMADLLAKLGYRRGDPLGVAVAGRIDGSGGWHAVNTGTLSAIRAVPLGAMIAAALGPATCMNDAAAAALAEAEFGAGRDATNFAYLTVSTGIGGGLVLGGRLLHSPNGLAGHVGFSTTPGGDALCGSGRHGTVETVAGGRAIAAMARSAGHDTDARGVSEAAQAGDAWAEEILTRSAVSVATLIADLVAILGLDLVAIGGSIGLSSGYVARVLLALDAEPELFRVAVRPAELGNDAPLLGALTFRDPRKSR